MRSPKGAVPGHLPPRVSFTQTFESSEQEREHKFGIDKSLIRGIRQNNSSLIIEEQPIEERTDGSAGDITAETEKIALDFRGRYDRVRTETSSLELRTEKMKAQLQSLREEERTWLAKNNQIRDNYRSTEARIANFDYELEQACLKLDARKNMEQRLKKDIIFYKKCLFDKTIDHRKKISDIRRLTTSSQREQRLSLRCRNILQSLEHTLGYNRYERNKGLELTDKAVARRRQYATRELERSRNIERSMEEALTMKLPEEREFIRMRLSQKFLKEMLKNKMNGLMNKYEEVNFAFTAIKQSTSVKTTEEFIHHYLYKDEIYGQLLESIAKAEEKIEVLKEEAEQLKEEGKRLEHLKDELGDMFKQKAGSQSEEVELNFSILEGKLQQINVYRNSITLWALCLLSMVRKTSRVEIRSKYSYLGDLLGDCLRMLLKILEEEEEKEGSIAQEALAKHLEKSKADAKELILRNIRIKTLGAETGRLEEEADYDLHSQKDFLQQARRNVKKKHFLRAN